MIELDLATVAEWTGGRLAGGAARTAFRGVSTDTRRPVAGTLFIALRGEHFDGHDFAGDAVQNGAAALLVEQELDMNAHQVIVADTRTALGKLGAGWRQLFDLPVIAVTGSNGKTTVKECIAAILRTRGPALSTRGNLNNDIGLPLMLCELDSTHTAGVFELGANRAGEIDQLARMARPDVGVITNAGPAHLEGFGSVRGVAHAKGELFPVLAADGTAIFPAASEWAGLWRDLAGSRRTLTFGDRLDVGADVQVGSVDDGGIELRFDGESHVTPFPLPGQHNRCNAAAAAAAAWAIGMEPATIAAGLAEVAPVTGRLVELPGPNGSLLLDDSYNANPGSFDAAFRVLTGYPGRQWAVVGEMAELGGETIAAHRRLGGAAREAGLERLWALGPSAPHTCEGFGAGAQVAEALDALADVLHDMLADDVTLLVKGSRANRLEGLVSRLAGPFGEADCRPATGEGGKA